MAKEKYTGPFLDGPKLRTEDLCYIAYCTGGTSEVNKICKPDASPAQINEAFAGNYDPSQLYTRFPNYVPPDNVHDVVVAYLAWKAAKPGKHHS